MKTADLKVTTRIEGSKSENRRLRREGLVPANIYGHGESNTYCSFDERDLRKAIGSSAAGNIILNLQSEDKVFQGKRVILKVLEKDPVTWSSVHADLYEVTMDRPIIVHVPIEFQGTPKGVKLDGGIFQAVRRSITIKGLVDDIPDSLKVDVSDLGVNESIHVGDLNLSEKWKLIDSAAYTVCSVAEQGKEEIAAPVAGAEATATADAAAAPAGEAAAAPAAAAEKK